MKVKQKSKNRRRAAQRRKTSRSKKKAFLAALMRERKKTSRSRKKEFLAALVRERTLQAEDVALTRLRVIRPPGVLFGGGDWPNPKGVGDLDRTTSGVGPDNDKNAPLLTLEKD